MKSLLILTLTVLSLFADSPQMASVTGDHMLDMQLSSELVFQDMVKIYDYKGNLVSEYKLNEVANNEISSQDHVLLEQSNFAFNYLGDYYYFTE